MMTRSALALAALGVALLVPGVARAAQPAPVSYHSWATPSQFNAGTYAGTAAASAGGITLASTGTSNVTYTDPRYGDIAAVAGTWTSPTYGPGFGFSELVSLKIARLRCWKEKHHDSQAPLFIRAHYAGGSDRLSDGIQHNG